MKRLFQWIGFALLAPAAVVECGQPGLTREGAYWVQTISGSEAMAPHGRLRVTAGGPVVINGGEQNACVYAIKLRVKSRTEAQALNELRGYRIAAARRGDDLVLQVPRAQAASEIRLTVPRGLRETRVTTVEGAVEANGLDGDVESETGGGALSFDRIGGSVDGRTAGGNIVLGTIEGAVRCVTAGGPISANVVRGEALLETGAGDITAQEVGGLLRATTAAGGIRIARAGSVVIASTAGGPIDVGRAGGMVTATSSGGPIQVGSASGVRCESAGGGIKLNNVSGSLRASTVVGSIMAQLLAGQPLGESFLTTGKGDITVFIPSNLGVTIRAENESSDSVRRIVSDFPEIAVRLRGTVVVAEGALHGGGPVLRITGTGGTIFLKRQ